MNISGIRIQAGFYDYNTIKNTQIQEESVPNVIDTAGKIPVWLRLQRVRGITSRIMVPQSMRNNISRMQSMI